MNPSLIAAAKTLLCIYLEDGRSVRADNILHDILGVKSEQVPGGGAKAITHCLGHWYDSPFYPALAQLVESGEVVAEKDVLDRINYKLKK